MKQDQSQLRPAKLRRALKSPIVITLTILVVGLGLFLGMYTTVYYSFLEITTDHELKQMQVMERVGNEMVDARLAELKGYCEDNLLPVELGLMPTDMAEREVLLRRLSLPRDGLNLAYWNDGELICWDDAYRGELEELDLASVLERKESVIFDPYFDRAGNYVLTVAAATQESSGVFIVQYDAFCMSEWLNATFSLMEFGTAYIVDSQGYNIASAQGEDWVITRYNAQIYARENPNTENVSIANLERQALEGKAGVGTYEWEGNQSYVAYGPLSEAPWGHYTGFYGAHFAAYTLDALAVSSRSAILLMLVFSAFMGGIMVLLFRSLTRAREYNEEILLQRMEAERRSRQDPLTGVKNKLAWQETNQQLEEEIQKGTARFAIGVCDINGLKPVNDTLGHEAGDDLIFRASRYICQIFSHSPVYRIGGDEFAVVLRDSELSAAEELSREFDLGQSRLALDEPGKPLISIALGLAHYQPGDSAVSDVFQRADQQMYRKKMAMKAESSL